MELFDLAEKFPQFLQEGSTAMQRDLAQAGTTMDAAKYASFALCFSLFFALAILATALAFSEPAQALALAAAAGIAANALLSAYPLLAKKKRAKRIEMELPLALRALSVELDLNTPFESALENVSQGYGAFSEEAARACNEMRRGLGVANALNRLAGRTDSAAVKRACMQLSFCYGHGSKTQGLRKLADELSAKQKTEVEEYKAKSSFTGLLFVTASCIVPALFGAYVVVGSAFLALTFTPTEILLAFLVGFPLVDLALLLYLKEAAPEAAA